MYYATKYWVVINILKRAPQLFTRECIFGIINDAKNHDDFAMTFVIGTVIGLSNADLFRDITRELTL